MKTLPKIILAALGLLIVAGCGGSTAELQQAPAERKIYLTVDFQKDQTLRYKFVSDRKIRLQWDPKTITRTSEFVEMVMAYTPIEINPYGLTTVKATCESIKLKRKSSGRSRMQDAAKNVKGKKRLSYG